MLGINKSNKSTRHLLEFSRSNEDISDLSAALLKSIGNVPKSDTVETRKQAAELQDLEGFSRLMSWMKYKELGDKDTAELLKEHCE